MGDQLLQILLIIVVSVIIIKQFADEWLHKVLSVAVLLVINLNAPLLNEVNVVRRVASTKDDFILLESMKIEFSFTVNA